MYVHWKTHLLLAFICRHSFHPTFSQWILISSWMYMLIVFLLWLSFINKFCKQILLLHMYYVHKKKSHFQRKDSICSCFHHVYFCMRQNIVFTGYCQLKTFRVLNYYMYNIVFSQPYAIVWELFQIFYSILF